MMGCVDDINSDDDDDGRFVVSQRIPGNHVGNLAQGKYPFFVIIIYQLMT
jgi:hypothetical protein